jgi:HD domain
VQLPAMPDSAACEAALNVAGEYCSPALLNHSVRSYLWAAWFAAAREIVFDAELLYVSAVLHDLGLVAEFDNDTLPFEFAGGHVASIFAAGAGWPRQRRQRVAEVIVAHMADTVDLREDPEGFLLERSTGFDISGRGPEDFPEQLQVVVMARYPRLSLAEEFLACFREQADRKPSSQAAAAVRSGIADRLAANPLEHR